MLSAGAVERATGAGGGVDRRSAPGCRRPPALDKAKAVIEPLTANPEAGIEGWRLLAQVAEASGDMPRAVRAYRKLLDAQPDNADLQNNLAYALLELGDAKDLPEARKLAEAAVAQKPSSSTYLDTLGPRPPQGRRPGLRRRRPSSAPWTPSRTAWKR